MKKKAEEEAKRKADEEAKKKAEEAKKKAEEEAKRKAEEEARKTAEEAKKRLEEEEKKKAEEMAKRKAEEEMKKSEDEAAKKIAESAREEAVVESKEKKNGKETLCSVFIRQFLCLDSPIIFWYLQRELSLIIYDRILSMGGDQLAAVAWGLQYLIYDCTISFYNMYCRFQIEHKELIFTQNRKKHILWILISSFGFIFLT